MLFSCLTHAHQILLYRSDRHQHPSGSDVDFLFQIVFFYLPKIWKDKGVITLTTLGKELIIKSYNTNPCLGTGWSVISQASMFFLPASKLPFPEQCLDATDALGCRLCKYFSISVTMIPIYLLAARVAEMIWQCHKADSYFMPC